MDEYDPLMELRQNVLVHLYNSAVLGSLRSTALALGPNAARLAKNPRLKDVQALYEAAGSDRRLFYAAAAGIAEFAVYCVLDFVEMYNRFESERNKDAYPHVTLFYESASPEAVPPVSLSQYGTAELGMLFKKVARSEEMRSLVESVIGQLAGQKGTL